MDVSKFISDFRKDISKIADIEDGAQPPRWWISTGNYVLNKIISGDYFKGYPQGRITSLTGPSGTGKSFLACNAIREFQQNGGEFTLVLDSENALDDDFVTKIGVKTSTDVYSYVPVMTISQTQNIVSRLIKQYKEEYTNHLEGPKVLIVIDSLDMLMTDTEEENFEKGVMKGDQGQRNKQLKAMLRSFVQAIKNTNIMMIVTNQVYKNQDVTNGEGVWIISDAVKFSLSQILLLTKLKLKDVGSSEVQGIRMKAEGYKTRFTKPYQTVTLEVPYETGMDPFSGLLESAVVLGAVEKAGSRYRFAGEDQTWFASDTSQREKMLIKVKAFAGSLKAQVNDDEDITEEETATEVKTKRKAKVSKEG
jgi:RecA/RadA recombinase